MIPHRRIQAACLLRVAYPWLRISSYIALLLTLFAIPLHADLPQNDSNLHHGVKTCAGAPCHGHREIQEEPIWLNEATLWRQEDLHARAYDVLLNAESKKIAKNLQLSKPAHQAKICLDCHSDNVPSEFRGEQFKISEGIGCEACHGGSEKWLRSHATGSSHAANISRGMYPTDQPEKRAELCLSCHFGTESKFVDHQLMGAGHPRQSFELYVFTQLMPAHYAIDQDYLDRKKQAPGGAQTWAIGQAEAVNQVLQTLLDPNRSAHGIWPEFVLFDCHACHHPLSDERWRPRPSVGLGPGLARLNDANFLMLRHSMELISPKSAERFQQLVRSLHHAMSDGVGKKSTIAQQLLELVTAFQESLQNWRVEDESVRVLTRRILQEGTAGEYVDYAGAEQATLALQVLVDELHNRQAYPEDVLATLGSQLPKLLTATKSPDDFQSSDFQIGMRLMRESLPADGD